MNERRVMHTFSPPPLRGRVREGVTESPWGGLTHPPPAPLRVSTSPSRGRWRFKQHRWGITRKRRIAKPPHLFAISVDDALDLLRRQHFLSSATLSGSTLLVTTSNVDRSFSGPMTRLTTKF